MADRIYMPMRTCVNKGHSSIFNDHAFNDMPNPPFPDENGHDSSKTGQWFAIHKNDKYGHLKDLNWEKCTGGQGSGEWRFKYLNGESEWGDGGAEKFGRGNGWHFDNVRQESVQDENRLEVNHAGGFFINNEAKKTLISSHSNGNLSRCFYSAITDHFNWGNDCTFSASPDKANYVPAKGITFRYRERCEDWYTFGYADITMRPLTYAALLYSKGGHGDPVYLAELIAFSNHEAQASGCLDFSKNWLNNARTRKRVGNLHYKTDWYFVKKDDKGEQYTKMAYASWDPQGSGLHSEDPDVYNNYNTIHSGTITATVSDQSIRKIQDQGLMCVGMIMGGMVYNGCGYTNTATLTYDMFDVKLLVPEYYGDNKIEIIDYEKIEKGEPLMTMILDEPTTCFEAHKNYMAKRESNTMTQLYVKQL